MAKSRRHPGSVPHHPISLRKNCYGMTPHTVAAQLRIFTGFTTCFSSLYNFVFIHYSLDYILLSFFIQSFIYSSSYSFYMDLFYAIRLTHNISLLTNLCSSICQIHGLPSTLKKNRLPSFSKDGSFFLLFSSYYSVLIVKLCSIPLSEAVIILRS